MHKASVDAETALKMLVEGNEKYVKNNMNQTVLTDEIRHETAANGQFPYAVIIACSDSRVPPEHIFSAGIGNLFVIRTAGAVVGDYELGSVEYAVVHLGVRLVLVMGHTFCGAVDAAMHSHESGYINSILWDIKEAIGNEKDVHMSEILEVKNSIHRLYKSPVLSKLKEQGTIAFKGAVYDIETGKVKFLD